MAKSSSKSKVSKQSSGICYLVGAGPGDPGLMTIRGKECIEIADVIVYDYLSNPVFLQWAKPDAELIYAGKKAKDHTLTQDQINALIVEKTLAGKIVTRLKGGDPMVFGRGGEEGQELRAVGVKFEIVPGISSTIGGPAFAGIPVTHRDHCSQLTIFTGHEDPTKGETSIDYEQIAKAPGTKVFLMGVGRMRVITEALVEAGNKADEPMALVRWASTGQQESLIGTVGTMADLVEKADFKAPAVAVIGDVVNCREDLNWFEERPLFGRKVVVTRTRAQSSDVSRKLRDLGADVLEMPTIKIVPPKDEREFAECVINAHTYEWLIFTSPNGVERFFEMFYRARKDAREIGGCRIAAIGPGTKAKIEEYHLSVDLMPEKHVAEELATAFETNKEVGDLENVTMLWIRAEEARTVISERLIEAGVILDEAIAYRTITETEDPTGAVERFKEEGADIITFTSSSTVECFKDLGLAIPKNTKIASIGPITSDTIREQGMEVAIEAEEFNIPGLIDAVLKLGTQS